ncbi:TetR/AcrR family transcriptional regulator [Candidatus Thalassolituus haligoni]|jgi:AcrR family transcriptional regulator|uniref:TetR/AcrR family transcriptional regulator n=1 Tax=Candidatus Thalassolituus haligoni TaxID=3100113 RepID=UPI003515A362|tara:strand:+ start:310 stop:921 length:612 start_codon:yes stop_codon:yes gene_type:complete
MSSPKLTRNDWINSAMNVLATGGIDLVRVDNLAKEMKITRGSFYYHFENRQELLQAILERWRIKATEAVIESLKKRSLNTREQLIELITLPYKGERSFEAASIEISLRAWARRDPMAKAAVEEVDSYRISYIEKLFMEMEHPQEQASDLAYLIYSYMVANSLMGDKDDPQSKADRARRLALFLSDNCPLTNCQHRLQGHASGG